MTRVASLADLDALLRGHRLVVVDYWASWCGPCRSYSPKFQRLEREMRRQFPDASATPAGATPKAARRGQSREDVRGERSEPVARSATHVRSFAFADCDIDLAQDVARVANVMSVPTTIAWTMGRGVLGGMKRKEALRFSGDRAWPEMVRTFAELVPRYS